MESNAYTQMAFRYGVIPNDKLPAVELIMEKSQKILQCTGLSSGTIADVILMDIVGMTQIGMDIDIVGSKMLAKYKAYNTARLLGL